jgi:hypothetical protein
VRRRLVEHVAAVELRGRGPGVECRNKFWKQFTD